MLKICQQTYLAGVCLSVDVISLRIAVFYNKNLNIHNCKVLLYLCKMQQRQHANNNYVLSFDIVRFVCVCAYMLVCRQQTLSHHISQWQFNKNNSENRTPCTGAVISQWNHWAKWNIEYLERFIPIFKMKKCLFRWFLVDFQINSFFKEWNIWIV